MERNNLFNVVCGRKAQTAANRIGWLAAMTVLVFGLSLTGCQYESAALSVSGGVKGTSLARNAAKVGVDIDDLATYLAGLSANTAANPYTVPIDPINISDSNNYWAQINSIVAADDGRYVIIDISACSATGNAIAGNIEPTGNDMNIIYNNPYMVGVILPNSLVTIGSRSFYNCAYLTSVTIPGAVTSIGDYGFTSSGLTSVALTPSTTVTLGTSAFASCASLASAALSNGVSSIGANAFANTGLTSISIPTSVTTIGSFAFQSCTSLVSASVPGTVDSLYMTFYNCTNLSSVTLNSGLVTIGLGVFWRTGLTSVSIPGTVTSLGQQAFAETALKKVEIPASVKTIATQAFNPDDSLTEVIFDADGVAISNDKTFPFPGTISLRSAYNAAGGGAGTYALDANFNWVKQ